MEDRFAKGVNYWPIDSAMNWWRRFDASVVSDDFSRIGEIGLTLVRIFLLWEDFQPLPKKISSAMLDRLVKVMDIALDSRLRVLPTLFTGHMSGANYLPPWMLESAECNGGFSVISDGKIKKNRIRNFYSDREIIDAQKLFAREVSGALQGHPSLWAWDLGNEPSNVARPPTRKDGLVWLEEIVTELKKRDERIPVTIGLHQQDLEEDRNMGPAEVSVFCDFLSMHSYPFYAGWAESPLDEDVIPFLGLLTRWLGSKEVLIEETGVPTSNELKLDSVFSEAEAALFFERLSRKLARYDFMGVLFWCFGDYAEHLWNEPPFDEKGHELYFGLFRRDRTPKEFVPILKGLSKHGGRDESTLDWIEVKREEYYQNPGENIKRLYLRFKERSA